MHEQKQIQKLDTLSNNNDNYLKQLQQLRSQQRFSKQNLAFGQVSFKQVCCDENGIQEIDQLAQENLAQYFGYNSLVSESNKLNKDEFGGGEMDGNFEGNNNEGDNNNEDTSSDLILYWRFDEGKGQTIEDLSSNNNTGIVITTEAGDNFWMRLDEGDPLEIEDKWGQKCPKQFSMNFTKQVRVSLEKKKLSGGDSAAKCFSLEMWIKPKIQHQACLINIANAFVVLYNQENEIEVMLNQAKIQWKEEMQQQQQNQNYEDEEEYQNNNNYNEENSKNLFEGNWNHIALTYSLSTSKLYLYINTNTILYSEVSLQADIFKGANFELSCNNEFIGEITEVRLWKRELQLDEIKDNYRMPLEFVYEKKKNNQFVLKMKQKNNENKAGGELQKFSGLAGLLTKGKDEQNEKNEQPLYEEQIIEKPNAFREINDNVHFASPEKTQSPAITHKTKFEQEEMKISQFQETKNTNVWDTFDKQQEPSLNKSTQSFGNLNATQAQSAMKFSDFSANNFGFEAFNQQPAFNPNIQSQQKEIAAQQQQQQQQQQPNFSQFDFGQPSEMKQSQSKMKISDFGNIQDFASFGFDSSSPQKEENSNKRNIESTSPQKMNQFLFKQYFFQKKGGILISTKIKYRLVDY